MADEPAHSLPAGEARNEPSRITGKQATGKGLRHGFGVAMVTAEKSLPIHVLSKLMGTPAQKLQKSICRWWVMNNAI